PRTRPCARRPVPPGRGNAGSAGPSPAVSAGAPGSDAAGRPPTAESWRAVGTRPWGFDSARYVRPRGPGGRIDRRPRETVAVRSDRSSKVGEATGGNRLAAVPGRPRPRED